jgi:hypothetical protein
VEKPCREKDYWLLRLIGQEIRRRKECGNTALISIEGLQKLAATGVQRGELEGEGWVSEVWKENVVRTRLASLFEVLGELTVQAACATPNPPAKGQAQTTQSVPSTTQSINAPETTEGPASETAQAQLQDAHEATEAKRAGKEKGAKRKRSPVRKQPGRGAKERKPTTTEVHILSLVDCDPGGHSRAQASPS